MVSLSLLQFQDNALAPVCEQCAHILFCILRDLSTERILHLFLFCKTKYFSMTLLHYPKDPRFLPRSSNKSIQSCTSASFLKLPALFAVTSFTFLKPCFVHIISTFFSIRTLFVDACFFLSFFVFLFFWYLSNDNNKYRHV